MIVCSNCKHQEPSGALYCSECGMQLVRLESQKTQQITPEVDSLQTAPISEYSLPESDAWISLHLIDSGQIISIAERTEFTLGRISDKQPIMPDVDLTPYQAFEHGISRLHAVIRLLSGQPTVMDLGSSNGTYLNGVRLIANVESPLRQSDLLALGKLKIQVILNIL
ncbi:MAG: FHA domain-containing protein [Anaerolineales bacterium]|nr:FHA domain-containing protein [Anaerolineales bacterium]